MADEGRAGGSTDEELTLPRATVQKVINDLMPKDMVCAKETRDLIIECCIEFIHLVSSEANEVCEKEAKKTIAPEHIISALKALGFEHYVEEVEGVFSEHKQQQKDREKKTSKLEQTGLSVEELQRQQEELFAAARANYAATGGMPQSSGATSE